MISILIKLKLRSFISMLTRGSKHKLIPGLICISILSLVIGGAIYAVFEELVPMFILADITSLFYILIFSIIVMLCILGSVFLVIEEIYNAKDNDLLLSLPIKQSDILLSRLVSILITNYLYSFAIALPALIISIQLLNISLIQMLIFICVVVTLPLLSMTVTCSLGYIIALLIAKTSLKNIIILGSYFLFFILYYTFLTNANDIVVSLQENGNDIISSFKQVLPMFYYSSVAILDIDFIALLIYLCIAIIPFVLVVIIMQSNYSKLISMQYAKKQKKNKVVKHNERSIRATLLYKEYKLYTSSPSVILNACGGLIYSIILAFVLISQASEIKELTQLLHFFPSMQWYAIGGLSLFACLGAGLNNPSASCVSLEGNNFWILKSLPITGVEIIKVKAIFHMLITLPGIIVFMAVYHFIGFTDVYNLGIIFVITMLYALFVCFVGLLLNLVKPRFDWPSSSACVKRSLPAIITIFGSFAVLAVTCTIYYLLFDIVPMKHYINIVLLVLLVIDIILWLILVTYGVKKLKKI